MSFTDFCSCAKRYWYVILIPVLIALTFAAFKLVPDSAASSYAASVTINVNSSVATVGGIAKNSAEEYARENTGLNIKTAADDNNNIVTINVSGNEEDAVVQAASNLADQIVSESESFFPDGAEITPGNYGQFVARAQSPVVAKNSQGGMRAVFTSLVIPLMAALLIAACIIIAIYMIRRPIIRKEDIEESFAINTMIPKSADTDFGDRLMANIRFATSQDVRQICIVPIQEEAAARKVSEALCASLKSEDLKVEQLHPAEALAGRDAPDESGYEVVDCDSVSASTDTLYASQQADAVVLVAVLWKDSMKELARSVEELNLAKAKLALCVLAK